MVKNAENVRVAVNGSIYRANTGTAAPADATTAWGAGWVDLGYISEDGFTEADDVDTEDITAWQNGTLVRRVISSQEKTFEFVCIESKTEVLELRHPGSDVSAGAMAVKPLTSGLSFALGFDVVDGSVLTRIVAPRCEVSDFEDIEYQTGEPIGYGVTVTVFPDATNTLVYKYSNSAAWA